MGVIFYAEHQDATNLFDVAFLLRRNFLFLLSHNKLSAHLALIILQSLSIQKFIHRSVDNFVGNFEYNFFILDFHGVILCKFRTIQIGISFKNNGLTNIFKTLFT